MNILLCTEDERYLTDDEECVRVLRAHASFGGEVHVVVLLRRAHEAKSPATQIEHVTRHEVVAHSMYFRARRGFRHMRTLPHDLVVALEPRASGLAALWVAHASKHAFVVHATPTFFASYGRGGIAGVLMRRFVRSVFAHAACVVVEREADRASLTAITGSSSVRVEVVPPLALVRLKGSHDTGALHAEYPNLRFLLVSVAKLNTPAASIKGLFAVFAELAKIYPWIGLLVLAPKQLKRALMREASRVGVNDRTAVHDSAEAYEHVMRGADALLLLDETQGALDHLHAAANYGIPIVTTEHNARMAGLTNDVSCFTCTPDSAQSAVTAVRSLVEHNEIRHRLAIGGRAAVPRTDELDDEAWAARLKEIYISLYSSSVRDGTPQL